MAKMVSILGYRCERCRHEWVPRNRERQPKVCPACKSPYWDRVRRIDDPNDPSYVPPRPKAK